MITSQEIFKKFPDAVARHDFKESGSMGCYRLLVHEIKGERYEALWLDVMNNGLLVIITGRVRRQDSVLVQSLDEVMAVWIAFQLTGV